MFRKNDRHQQMPMFSSINSLPEKQLKRLEESWAGTFYHEFFAPMDEEIFAVLYFQNIPVVNMIYSSIKDLVNAFVGDKKQFDRPVMVNLFPGGGIQIMGFVTRESLTNFGMAENVAVHVPQSFNFGGNVLVVPKEQVTPLELESGKVVAFIVSGGASG